MTVARLTPRDVSILEDVWLYRYMTTKQLSRLHFSNVKVAQRRLRALAERKLVDRFQPSELLRSGFKSWWYRLSPPGARIIAENESRDAEELLPPTRRPRTMGFLAHHSLTTDFRIWLREASSTSDFTYEFIPSYEEVRGRRQRRVAISVPGHRRVLIPDGAFTLERRGKRALFFLEMDRGTEPLTGRHPSAVKRKLVRYRDAYETRAAEQRFQGLFQARFNGFRILCLVPDTSRRGGFLNVAQQVDLVPLVWVTPSALVEEPGRLDRECWAVELDEPLHRLTE